MKFRLKRFYSFVILTILILSVSVVYRFNNVHSIVIEAANSSSVHLQAIDASRIEFSTAKILSSQLLNLIRHRYELGDSIGSNFFNTANNIANFHWDIIKYKILTKALTVNSTFLMVFGGSSVTAGHDNHFNQSYPMIVKKRMQPLFDILGIELKVHNIAQGANNCLPYAYCYESMGGLDPDFINFEQSYNCGRAEDVFELVGRYAGWSKNQGLAYYSASGAWSPSDCPHSEYSIPYSSEDWKPEFNSLPDFEFTEQILSEQKKILNDYFVAKPSASRFIGWSAVNYDSSYHGVAPHGFNVWEANPLCTYINKEGKRTTGCNGLDAVQHCKMKFMTFEASLYGSDDQSGANWHPTRAFHMLRGEAIVWIYTLAYLDAVYTLETDLQDPKNTVSSLYEKYQNIVNTLHPPLPSPKKCLNYHCDRRPICYTDFKPHYEPSLRLSNLVVGKHNWTLDDDVYSEWSTHYGYLDLKTMYRSEGPHLGEIHFRFQVRNTNFILLCGQVSESLLHVAVYIDLHYQFSRYPNGTSNYEDYEPSQTRQLWSKKKYFGAECKYIIDLPVGDHVLSLKPNISHPNHVTGISHIIMWP